MPFSRPTPQEIRDRIGADIVRLLGGTAAMLRRSVEWVFVRMQSIASHELHGHLAWIARQVLVDQADDEELERHAGIWGVQRRAATRAAGVVRFRGAAGAQIPAGTELRRGDDQRYSVDTSVVIAGNGEIEVDVAALQVGETANSAIGDNLVLVTPLTGVQSGAVVVGVIAGGRDVENDASLRARVLTRIQQPPHGGAAHDYVAWVRAIVGETPVWVYPNRLGLGSVSVSFVMPDGTMPSPATVDQVRAYIEQERPVTAEVNVVSPVAVPLNFTIKLTPDTALVRAMVHRELGEMIVREAEPGGTLAFSRISAAISAAAGEYSHTLVTPVSDVTTPFGEIFRLGTIEWVVE